MAETPVDREGHQIDMTDPKGDVLLGGGVAALALAVVLAVQAVQKWSADDAPVSEPTVEVAPE